MNILLFLLQSVRDPVHDFGFFKFDPSKVKFMPLCEIEMAPDGAKGEFVFKTFRSCKW